MKSLLKFAASLFAAHPLNPLDRELLDFSEGKAWTVGDAHHGTLLLGSPGKGKSVASRTLLYGFFKRGYGGLVNVVKPSLTADVLAIAEATGRTRDVIVLRPGGAHRINPFGAVPGPSDAAAMIGEVCDAQSCAAGGSGIENAGEWRGQRDMLLTHLCVVCEHLHGTVDSAHLQELFESVPYTVAGRDDPAWRRDKVLGRLLSEVGASPPGPLAASLRFLTVTFPAYPDRTQGSIRSMVTLAFHDLTRSPLAELFSGEPTVSMDEVLNHRKILVVDVPAMSSTGGRAANAILQYAFCKSAKTLSRHTDAFLFADECQECIGRELMQSLSLFREYRISTVLITQNIAVLNARLGKAQGEELLELLSTMAFLGQGDAGTREWAARHIGKRWKTRYTDTRSDGKTSTSSTRVLEDKVHATEFADLRVGESIVSYNGKHWRAKWPKSPEGRGGTVRAVR